MHRIIASIIVLLGFSSAQASDFSPNVEMNQKAIQALIAAGSNPNKPHPLEHHFYCYSPESLQSLLAKGESLGYRAAHIGDDSHEDTHYWYGDLIKETALDLGTINQQNSLMLKLADEFNADYDGWGTSVVK